MKNKNKLTSCLLTWEVLKKKSLTRKTLAQRKATSIELMKLNSTILTQDIALNHEFPHNLVNNANYKYKLVSLESVLFCFLIFLEEWSFVFVCTNICGQEYTALQLLSFLETQLWRSPQ